MLRALLGRPLRLLGNLFPFSLRIRLVAWLVPTRYWYRLALFASHLQGQVKTRFGGNGALTEALMLDNWMRELTLSAPYPIPWRPGAVDVLSQQKPGHGILYCWTHLPLVEVPLRALLDLGHSPDMVVADPGKIVNGDEFVVPGHKSRLKAVPADRRVLIRVRTALARGGSVACLADAELFGPLSSQVLQVAGRVGAFVIFQWAERESDDTLRVTFQPAPHPLCRTEEEIAENMEFLRAANKEALRRLGILPDWG